MAENCPFLDWRTRVVHRRRDIQHAAQHFEEPTHIRRFSKEFICAQCFDRRDFTSVDASTQHDHGI